MRGEVVEVYLNDEYRGIYCFTECMDRKQLKLKKFDQDGTFGNLLALFNPDNLYSRYESYYNILKQSGAAEREE